MIQYSTGKLFLMMMMMMMMIDNIILHTIYLLLLLLIFISVDVYIVICINMTTLLYCLQLEMMADSAEVSE